MTDARDFSWLEDTYWYVPAADLPAVQYDAAKNTLAWIVDQTVWHITGYRDGYFWGICSVLIHDAGDDVSRHGRGARPTGLALLGSITPEGSIHLTFVPGAALTSRSATIGIGRAIGHEGGIALEMQMSTGTLERTAHWASMMQTKLGDPSWDALPGVGLSVPEMLDGLDPPRISSGKASMWTGRRRRCSTPRMIRLGRRCRPTWILETTRPRYNRAGISSGSVPAARRRSTRR